MRASAFSTVLIVALAAGSAASAAASGAQQLVDIEANWSKAYVNHNIAFLDSTIADDWTSQDDSGKPIHKADLIGNVKSGKMKTAMMSNHDVHARIVGDIAIVQGADDEKSSFNGKDTSGTYTWTDIFQKRGGQWKAIASQVTPVARK